MYDAKNNTIIDLTHEITEKTPSWDLSCGFHTKNICDYDDFNGEFKIRAQSFEIIAGTGTHMDAPAHFIKNSAGISELKLENLIAPCIVINVSEKAHALYTISLDDITTFEKIHGEIHPGNFILFYTGWSKHWNEPINYKNEGNFPSISVEVAAYLLEKNSVGIGIDTFSPDRPADGFPLHNLWLGAGNYIVENIANAHRLPTRGSTIFAIPPKLQGATETPIRLFAIVKN